MTVIQGVHDGTCSRSKIGCHLRGHPEREREWLFQGCSPLFADTFAVYVELIIALHVHVAHSKHSEEWQWGVAVRSSRVIVSNLTKHCLVNNPVQILVEWLVRWWLRECVPVSNAKSPIAVCRSRMPVSDASLAVFHAPICFASGLIFHNLKLCWFISFSLILPNER